MRLLLLRRLFSSLLLTISSARASCPAALQDLRTPWVLDHNRPVSMEEAPISAAATLSDGSIFEDRLRQWPVVYHVDVLAAQEVPCLATPT